MADSQLRARFKNLLNIFDFLMLHGLIGKEDWSVKIGEFLRTWKTVDFHWGPSERLLNSGLGTMGI